MIGVIACCLMIGMGIYTAIRGQRRLSRLDWWLNTIATLCAAGCLALQVVG